MLLFLPMKMKYDLAKKIFDERRATSVGCSIAPNTGLFGIETIESVSIQLENGRTIDIYRIPLFEILFILFYVYLVLHWWFGF